jgi:polysaccharide export outer membrane protein
MNRVLLSIAISALVLVGCSSAGGKSLVQYEETLGAPDRATAKSMAQQDYEIGPLDKINVKVFGQENLSVEKVQVDASGQVVLPLVGAVEAAGKTPKMLSEEIASRLAEKYLQEPHVSVMIDDAVSQRVTVTGAVIESGIYPLKGRTSLLQAVAMAKGPDPKIANMRQVIVFRTIEGRRAAARFDLAAIRSGDAADPEIYGGDSVVVQGSAGKQIWRELAATLPALGAFAFF